jgi:hypothetical protein
LPVKRKCRWNLDAVSQLRLLFWLWATFGTAFEGTRHR